MDRKWRGFSLYLPGTIFVVLGILVVLFPMLLIALISAGLMLIGFMGISVAHRVRKLRRGAEWTVVWEPIEPFVGEWFERGFVYRRR